MNEESAKENSETHYVDTWDMDTVEFEVSFAPWPLRWDAAKRNLTWAIDPDTPEEDAETWARLLEFIRQEIIYKTHTHVQVAEAIYKAFPMDTLLKEKGVRIVKYHECHMPEGWKH